MKNKKIIIVCIVISISLLIVTTYEYIILRKYQFELGISYMHNMNQIKNDSLSITEYLKNTEKLDDFNLLRYSERFNVYDSNSGFINMLILQFHIRAISRKTYNLAMNINDETKTIENSKTRNEIITLAERLKLITELIDEKYHGFRSNSDIRRCYMEISDESSSIYKKIDNYLINEDQSNPIINGVPVFAKNIH